MFSHRWMRHEVIWQHWRHLSSRHWLASDLPVHIHVFWGGVAFESDYAGRVVSYAFKASLLLLASLKSPTLVLNQLLTFNVFLNFSPKLFGNDDFSHCQKFLAQKVHKN